MKIILIFLNIAWSIFCSYSVSASDAAVKLGLKIAQQDYSVHYCQTSNDTFLLGDCLADFTDDDSNDSERKKTSSGKIAHSNTAFGTQNFAATRSKNTYSNFFFPLHTALFIFIRALRI
jgi:hypothetical protein